MVKTDKTCIQIEMRNKDYYYAYCVSHSRFSEENAIQ